MDLLARLEADGVLLESAKGPVANVAELVVGAPVRGSWWSHPDSHAVFEAINVLADHPDVVRTRLLNGKVTLLHRRVWPALVVLADRFPAERLAALHEEHTASGRHQVVEVPFPDWVPEAERTAALQLVEAEAEAQLSVLL